MGLIFELEQEMNVVYDSFVLNKVDRVLLGGARKLFPYGFENVALQ